MSVVEELRRAIKDPVTGEPLNPEAITGLTAAEVERAIQAFDSLERMIQTNQIQTGRYIDQLRSRIVQSDIKAERATKLYHQKHGHVAKLLDDTTELVDKLYKQLEGVQSKLESLEKELESLRPMQLIASCTCMPVGEQHAPGCLQTVGKLWAAQRKALQEVGDGSN